MTSGLPEHRAAGAATLPLHPRQVANLSYIGHTPKDHFRLAAALPTTDCPFHRQSNHSPSVAANVSSLKSPLDYLRRLAPAAAI
jgi:hypothetical protein